MRRGTIVSLKSGKGKKVYEERLYCQFKERERLISIDGALPGTR